MLLGDLLEGVEASGWGHETFCGYGGAWVVIRCVHGIIYLWYCELDNLDIVKDNLADFLALIYESIC